MARPTSDNKTANSVTTNDGFSDVLAGVVNTPGLNVKVVEKSVPSVQDTVAVVKTQSVKPEIEQTSINTIRQLGKAVDKDGSTLVYLDKSGASSDTIHIFIANEPIPEPTIVKETVVEKSAIKDTSATNVVVTNPVDTTTKQPAKEPGFMAIELPNPNLLVDTAKKSPPMEEVNKEEIKKEEVLSIPKPETVNLPVTIRPKISIINSDCKQLATDEDFLKLRKKMASYDKDEDMITAARKNFKAKCFSTEQVKNLSVLFLTDAGKYQFFDVAYPFVHDSSSFASLQSQLTDSYYLNRFKAMVRQ
ncbi:MAG: DUF4476 domain-containing protein [Ferruginibacter sp.]